ncbi:MAG: hypothetical protein M0P39_12245 [Rhodocyclaceae bacterium]|nr:hypothetical protein [Rhodocyclaceae bacterium]
MKSRLLSALVVLGLLSAGNAWADRRHGHDRGRVHFGVTIGPWAPWYYPPHFYYPPAYYPPIVVTPPAPQPQVYIEQSSPPATVQTNYYWYYCPESKIYYPYVKECPSGWQKVTPQPPAQP